MLGVAAVGSVGGDGLGAELQGSRPSESYTELARGLSIKLAPKFVVEDVPYGCAGLGALNIVADGDEWSSTSKRRTPGW